MKNFQIQTITFFDNCGLYELILNAFLIMIELAHVLYIGEESRLTYESTLQLHLIEFVSVQTPQELRLFVERYSCLHTLKPMCVRSMWAI